MREPSEESVTRSRSARPVRASSQQRLQRNKSSESVTASQGSSPAPATTSSARNKSTEPKNGEDSSGKAGTSLVPPPSSSAHLPPPSPLRQSAIPVRLAEKLATLDSSPLDPLMTRSVSHGGLAQISDTAIPVTRGSKRRQSSAGPSFEGGEDEDDVSKRLRRALTASIPVGNPSLLAPGSPKRASRSTRPTTRYATRSAPNSPPQESSTLFEAANLDAAPPPGVGRAGRAGLRRTMSHDALPEGEDGGV